MEVTIDPTGAFKGVPQRGLFESCGLIPYFVAEAASTSLLENSEDVMEVMREAYGFSTKYNFLAKEGSQVDKDGVYSTSDEDPDLSPFWFTSTHWLRCWTVTKKTTLWRGLTNEY